MLTAFEYGVIVRIEFENLTPLLYSQFQRASNIYHLYHSIEFFRSIIEDTNAVPGQRYPNNTQIV